MDVSSDYTYVINVNNYYKKRDENYKDDWNTQLSVLQTAVTNKNPSRNDINVRDVSNQTHYWLASRETVVREYVRVFPLSIYLGILTSDCTMLNVNTYSTPISYSFSFGFRPCIFLRPNIEIESGDGTIDNPYVLK